MGEWLAGRGSASLAPVREWPEAGADWRDGDSYSPLLRADRSLIAWEWLRREPRYRAAARLASTRPLAADMQAARFGLVAFESPLLAVPDARPLWRSENHPFVLAVEARPSLAWHDAFELERLAPLVTCLVGEGREHLLLSDGLRAIRLDGPAGTFSNGPATLAYLMQGIGSAERPLRTLRRFLALCRSGSFSSALHRPETRARRWVLMLRAWDALCQGAHQRQIAEALLSGSAAAPRWRSRQSSLRSQAQRLVRSARLFADGGYRVLLA